MFIIWGWRGIQQTIDRGLFFCPTCRCDTPYDHQQVRTFFTIFFMPVIPLGPGQRFVLCHQCQMTFFDDVLLLSPPQESGSRFTAGDRILAKRGEFWYPGTVRSSVKKKVKVDFDDGKHDLFPRSQVIPLDLQVGDPIYVRRQESTDYQFATITANNGDSLQVRFEDGRQEWTKLPLVRVIWEDEAAE